MHQTPNEEELEIMFQQITTARALSPMLGIPESKILECMELLEVYFQPLGTIWWQGEEESSEEVNYCGWANGVLTIRTLEIMEEKETI